MAYIGKMVSTVNKIEDKGIVANSAPTFDEIVGGVEVTAEAVPTVTEATLHTVK